MTPRVVARGDAIQSEMGETGLLRHFVPRKDWAWRFCISQRRSVEVFFLALRAHLRCLCFQIVSAPICACQLLGQLLGQLLDGSMRAQTA
jgi:hypothetical protein